MAARLVAFSGALLLFVAWLTQQFLYEKWNGRLRRIAEARGAFQTYQSNNAVFNALIEIAPDARQQRIRSLQITNYRFGLSQMREALSEGRVRRLDERIQENVRRYRGSMPDDLAEIQGELEAIQVAFGEETRDIERRKSVAQYVFWAVYITGSVFVLIGGVLKS